MGGSRAASGRAPGYAAKALDDDAAATRRVRGLGQSPELGPLLNYCSEFARLRSVLRRTQPLQHFPALQQFQKFEINCIEPSLQLRHNLRRLAVEGRVGEALV